jgi:hypothetical protein
MSAQAITKAHTARIIFPVPGPAYASVGGEGSNPLQSHARSCTRKSIPVRSNGGHQSGLLLEAGSSRSRFCSFRSRVIRRFSIRALARATAKARNSAKARDPRVPLAPRATPATVVSSHRLRPPSFDASESALGG